MPSVPDLDDRNVAVWFRERTGAAASSAVPLSGGVSNTVLLLQTAQGPVVVKQALARLRVQEEWLCDRSRILRESQALRMLHPLLPPGSVPEVVMEDASAYAYAMRAAPEGSETWKALLLRGGSNQELAWHAGALLGAIIRTTSGDPEFELQFGDLEAFEQLRLDPYYRHTATRHPAVREYFEELIADCRTRRVCLVHGDWSPKNFLVTGSGIMAIDWECVHYGNPAFDAAFGINHLLLKSFHLPELLEHFAGHIRQFQAGLEAADHGFGWLETASLRHLAGLLLARMDGKSPVEYIQEDELRASIRGFALDLIGRPAQNVEELLQRRSDWR